MLTLTHEAATEIRSLVDQPDAPDGCGLRIATDPSTNGLTLTLALVPADDDKVLDEAGARLFLEPQAASILDDKTLDVAPQPDGAVHFAVVDQPS